MSLKLSYVEVNGYGGIRKVLLNKLITDLNLKVLNEDRVKSKLRIIGVGSNWTRIVVVKTLTSNIYSEEEIIEHLNKLRDNI